jgi:glutathione synthase
VTSVGALRKSDALLGWTLCADLVDGVLHPDEAVNPYQQRRSA